MENMRRNIFRPLSKVQAVTDTIFMKLTYPRKRYVKK